MNKNNINKLNLIINAGSATYKYSLFAGEEKVLHALYQKKSQNEFELYIEKVKIRLSKAQYENSLSDFLKRRELKKYFDHNKLNAIGFRVVHGGAIFRQTSKVSKSVLNKLKQLDDLAPLHNPFARKLIEQSEKILPNVEKYLIFDTAFHSTIPEKNWRYAIPKRIADKNNLRRYGFHGTVYSSIVEQLRSQKRLPKKLIVCHLGGGCSVTAIKDGTSIDTSMGFTPLEGLVMATRAGDIDPGLIIYLQKKLKLSLGELLKLLNNESGLKGLAGSRDMRDVLKKAKNNADAKLALEIFCSRAAKYIASYIVSLGGIDQIIFSGGIGENSPEVREKICEYLKPFGVKINPRKNNKSKAGEKISSIFSRQKIFWMHADEATEMNRTIKNLN